jgi:O-antigen/teichoic acid export membrane protein
MGSSTATNLRVFLKNSILTFSQRFLNLILGTAISIILARSLGREGVGVLTLTLLFSTLVVTFVNFGVPAASVYLLGSRQYHISEVVFSNLSISVMQSILGIIAGLIALFFFGDQILANIEHRYLFWVLLIIPLRLLNLNLRAIFQAISDFRAFNLTAITGMLFTLPALIALYFCHSFTILNVIFVNILAQLFTFILVLILLRGYVSHLKIALTLNMAYLKDSVGYGLKVYITSIFTFFNYKQDRFILNVYLTPASVGVYNVGANLSEKLWMLSHSVSMVLFPKIASLENDERQRRWITPFIARHVFTGTAIAAAILYVLAPFLIGFFYGQEFIEAADVLRIILPGVVALTVSRLIANDIAGRGHPGINTILSIIMVIINLTANIIFIPRMGIRGAALASTVSYSFNALLRLVIYCHIAQVSWLDIFLLKRSDLQEWRRLAAQLRQHSSNR